MKRTALFLCLIVIVAGIAYGQTGIKKKRALPHEYGTVIINNYSEKAGMAPVQFDHWIHRSQYTCRLCHVDIAFAMKANGSNIKAADNKKGFYCGTCHNGKMLRGDKPIFASCQPLAATAAEAKVCERCHSVGKNVTPVNDFYTVTKRFPKERFGNGINWERAESDGYITLTDAVEGVSIKKKPMAVQKDFSITAKVSGMSDITFSHAKHTVWNGCEVCHPELFVGVKRGMTKYSMADFYEGKFCGACHLKVAFPLLDCQRCHMKNVEVSLSSSPAGSPKGM